MQALERTRQSVIEGDIAQARLQTMRMSKAVRNLVANAKSIGLAKAQGPGTGTADPRRTTKKAAGDAPKEGDVISDPDIKVGRGRKVDIEEDPDVEKDREEEQGGEDDNEYKETSDTKEDKIDLEGEMKEHSFIKKKVEAAKNLAEMSSAGDGLAQQSAGSSVSINLCRLNEIENQIRTITQMVEQIKDKGKKEKLVAGIAPVLEQALEKFMNELQKEEDLQESAKASKTSSKSTAGTKAPKSSAKTAKKAASTAKPKAEEDDDEIEVKKPVKKKQQAK